MPRDYAKKRRPQKNKRGASRSQPKNKVPVGLWFLTGVIVCAFLYGLYYLKWGKKPSKNRPEIAQPIIRKPAQNSKNQNNTDVVDEVPFYDVHKDLTNKKVEIPKEDLKLPENYKQYYYTMPCGSFRDEQRADGLKAIIALTGNNSEIKSVQWKGETWYRVQLGPFSSKRTAEKIKHRLENNNLHDCQIIRHIKK